MKIRNGFVSNSSSSNFIIFGKYIDICDISFDTIKENDIYAFGMWMSEGQDIFKINTPDILAFIKAHYKLRFNKFDFEFVKSFAYLTEDVHEIDLSKMSNIGKVNIIQGSKDYNSSDNINDVKNKYDKNNKLSNEMIKILRAEKIDKIEK